MVSLAGQEGGMCQGDPAGAVFLLPPGMLGSSSALSFQLPAPPPPPKPKPADYHVNASNV